MSKPEMLHFLPSSASAPASSLAETQRAMQDLQLELSSSLNQFSRSLQQLKTMHAQMLDQSQLSTQVSSESILSLSRSMQSNLRSLSVEIDRLTSTRQRLAGALGRRPDWTQLLAVTVVSATLSSMLTVGLAIVLLK